MTGQRGQKALFGSVRVRHERPATEMLGEHGINFQERRAVQQLLIGDAMDPLGTPSDTSIDGEEAVVKGGTLPEAGARNSDLDWEVRLP